MHNDDKRKMMAPYIPLGGGGGYPHPPTPVDS